MTTAEDVELEEEDRSRKPSKAVVGSHREEEEVFGKAIDPKIIRRIWAFVHPYRSKILLSVGAVLAFTATQLAIPLIIRFAIDRGMPLSEGRWPSAVTGRTRGGWLRSARRSAGRRGWLWAARRRCAAVRVWW